MIKRIKNKLKSSWKEARLNKSLRDIERLVDENGRITFEIPNRVQIEAVDAVYKDGHGAKYYDEKMTMPLDTMESGSTFITYDKDHGLKINNNSTALSKHERWKFEEVIAPGVFEEMRCDVWKYCEGKVHGNVNAYQRLITLNYIDKYDGSNLFIKYLQRLQIIDEELRGSTNLIDSGEGVVEQFLKVIHGNNMIYPLYYVIHHTGATEVVDISLYVYDLDDEDVHSVYLGRMDKDLNYVFDSSNELELMLTHVDIFGPEDGRYKTKVSSKDGFYYLNKKLISQGMFINIPYALLDEDNEDKLKNMLSLQAAIWGMNEYKRDSRKMKLRLSNEYGRERDFYFRLSDKETQDAASERIQGIRHIYSSIEFSAHLDVDLKLLVDSDMNAELTITEMFHYGDKYFKNTKENIVVKKYKINNENFMDL